MEALLLSAIGCNPILLQFSSIVQQFFDHLREFAPRVVIETQPDQGLMAGKHRQVIDALRQRQVEAAQRVMRLHFNPLPSDL